MKSITVENVRSFRENTTLEFDGNFNILIGPNAGGKSNLLDIITIAIRHYFMKTFTVNVQSDQSGIFYTIEQTQLFNLVQDLEKYTGNENDASSIEVAFEVTKGDLENINEIRRKKEIFKENLMKYRNGTTFIGLIDSVCQNLESSDLKEGMELRYTIRNHQPPALFGWNERAYLGYLNNLELFLILSEGEIDLKPIYLYFSPYRAINVNNLQTNLSARNFYQLYRDYAKSTSRSMSSTIELACFYFSEKRRKLEADAKDYGYYDQWKEDEEVKLVTKYLNKLGYEWDISLVDPNKNIYELLLKKDGKELSLPQASSGEKEMINFLLGIFAFNIKNGLIIIDEPDLHLHPQWQRLLLELFLELSDKTDNQFIIATHSPVFINEKTISNVIRVYKDDSGTSRCVKVGEEHLPQVKDVLHVVNSYNNEKLFFADKVVLVEGITDKLILEKLISFYKSKSGRPQVVEVLNVDGKNNFDKYKSLLEEIKCEYYIVADLDYVRELAEKDKNEQVKSLFNVNYSKIDKTIKDKRSLDGKKLSEIIEDAINIGKITEELKSVWEYIKSRHLRLKDELTEKEKNILKEYIEQKEKENIFILYGGYNFEHGELEDFLPYEYRSPEGIIELTKPDKFENWLKKGTYEVERLKKIVYRILGI